MAKAGRKPKLTVVGGAGTGSLTHDNTKNALSDDQILALTLQHKGLIEAATAAKKQADADFKNAFKKAKAELGQDGLDDIKDMIAAEKDPKFEEKLKSYLERQARLANWLGLEIGTQGQLFATTAPSQFDRAYAEGKRIAMGGGECKTDFSPGTEGYDGFMKGWHEGAGIKAAMDREQDEGAKLLRPQGNESAGPDAFDTAADSAGPDAPVEEPADPDTVVAAEGSPPGAPESQPWPDEVQVAERQPAEVL